jgi:hypothetical protein
MQGAINNLDGFRGRCHLGEGALYGVLCTLMYIVQQPQKRSKEHTGQ